MPGSEERENTSVSAGPEACRVRAGGGAIAVGAPEEGHWQPEGADAEERAGHPGPARHRVRPKRRSRAREQPDPLGKPDRGCCLWSAFEWSRTATLSGGHRGRLRLGGPSAECGVVLMGTVTRLNDGSHGLEALVRVLTPQGGGVAGPGRRGRTRCR